MLIWAWKECLCVADPVLSRGGEKGLSSLEVPAELSRSAFSPDLSVGGSVAFLKPHECMYLVRDHAGQ